MGMHVTRNVGRVPGNHPIEERGVDDEPCLAVNL